ncbi:hypothetical protein B484DRAFT_114143 [Ochromonadaceae sp. CCMP2298]|nr:hypothetical protein B484DRAFT_114143 [Ochromonadaceae sp. CCMP2298]
MSTAEAGQCAQDIMAWFTRSDCRMGKGADSVDFQRLEKTIDTELPPVLKIILESVNGGLFFMDKKQLNTDEIADCAGQNEKSKAWKQGLIPFGSDGDTLLVVDTTRGDEVFEWDEDGLGDCLAPSLVRYLEDYRNALLGGSFEYLEDIGVVEKMGASKAPRK